MDQKLGLMILENAYIGYFSCQIIGAQFGVIQYTKVPMLRFSKGYTAPSFQPIWIKLYEKYGNWGNTGYYQVLFWQSAKFKKIVISL